MQQLCGLEMHQPGRVSGKEAQTSQAHVDLKVGQHQELSKPTSQIVVVSIVEVSGNLASCDVGILGTSGINLNLRQPLQNMHKNTPTNNT